MYIALTYVNTGRQVFAPGEVIEEDANAEWHLKIVAIRPMNEERRAQNAEPEDEAPAEIKAPEEIAEEADVNPEIDIMDGIVKKPIRKKTTRKKGGDEA